MNYQLYFYASSVLGLILVAINIVQNGMNNRLHRKQLQTKSAKIASQAHSIKAKDRKIELLAEESKHYMGKMFYREDIIDAERAKHKLEVDRLKEELYAFHQITKKKNK